MNICFSYKCDELLFNYVYYYFLSAYKFEPRRRLLAIGARACKCLYVSILFVMGDSNRYDIHSPAIDIKVFKLFSRSDYGEINRSIALMSVTQVSVSAPSD